MLLLSTISSLGLSPDNTTFNLLMECVAEAIPHGNAAPGDADTVMDLMAPAGAQLDLTSWHALMRIWRRVDSRGVGAHPGEVERRERRTAELLLLLSREAHGGRVSAQDVWFLLDHMESHSVRFTSHALNLCLEVPIPKSCSSP